MSYHPWQTTSGCPSRAARLYALMVAAVVAGIGAAVPPAEAAGAVVRTIEVSVSSGGGQVKDGGFPVGISRYGHVVLFDSHSGRLVRRDTNKTEDVFVHHRVSGRTELISIALNGKAGNGFSHAIAITPNGRFVLFDSLARNLTLDSDPACCEANVFVRDRWRRVTRRASDLPGTHFMYGVAISADGRYVLMEDITGTRLSLHDMTRDRNLLTRRGLPIGLSPDGRFVAYCVHCAHSDRVLAIRDRTASRTRLVPLAPQWVAGSALFDTEGRVVFFDADGPNGFSVLRWRQGARQVSNLTPGLGADLTSLSSNGNLVGFVSDAAGIVPGDTNGSTDLFRMVVATGTVTRLDLGSSGNQIQHGVSPTPLQAFMSANGHWATWASKGTDIVLQDTDTTPDTFERGRIP